ncbi:MAG: hypothetical protein ACJAUV_000757 [Flavobacteriales bacterium]|jgi:hypothetical protein
MRQISTILFFFSIIFVSQAQHTTSGCSQNININSQNIQLLDVSKQEYRICSGEAYQGINLIIDAFHIEANDAFVVKNDINNTKTSELELTQTNISFDKKKPFVIQSNMRCVVIILPTSGDWMIKAHTECFETPKEKLNLKTAVSPKQKAY